MEQPFKDVKLLIGIPSTGTWSGDMGLSFVLMVHMLTCYAVPFHIQQERGSILPQLRQNLLDRAIKDGATHLLFIDSDQTFPHELGVRWLQKDFPVVAANIATKAFPSNPTARQEGNRKVFSDAAADPFEKVWRVGTGLMMLKREAFVQLPKPAFEQRWREESGTFQGEDWTLCEHLEALGIPIRVDHALSLQVGHVGFETYTHDHVVLSRRMEAENGNH